MTLYEIEGFLRGKCLPGDLLVGESTAEYIFRKFKERDALSAENAQLKSTLKFAVPWLPTCDDELSHRIELAENNPATDAAIAEMQARGVDMAIEHLLKKFGTTGQIGVPVMALEWLAKELRNGEVK